MTIDFPLAEVRARFPALAHFDDGRPRIYADNPAGTQVPATVADAVRDAMLDACANLGGHFVTTLAAGEICDTAHVRAAQFLGAASPREIVIGQSMTSLTFHLSRSICRDFKPGDEIVVTRMEHEGNVGPWLEMAADRDLRIVWLPFDADTWKVEPVALAGVLSDRTRLVCLNHASNLTGAVNDVAALTAAAKEAGALVYVDAVQSAPHHLIDVEAIGCDFLVCSAYKFFGPHLGVLYAREDVAGRLHAYKGRCVSDAMPDRFEAGTPQVELLAGLTATVDYFCWLGRHATGSDDAREQISAAYALSRAYEEPLTARLIAGLDAIPGLTVYGITNPNRMHERVPTVSLRIDGVHPRRLAEGLAAENIFVWDGHNYAIEPAGQLAIPLDEGVLRIGLAHYNAAEEVDRIAAAIGRLTRLG